MPSPTSQRTTLRSKVLTGFGLVLVMLALIATISIQSTRGFTRTSLWVAVTHEAIEVQERILRKVSEMDAHRRLYLITLDTSNRAPFRSAQTEIRQAMNSLHVLTSATPAEAARVDDLEQRITRLFEIQNAQMDGRAGVSNEEIDAAVTEIQRLIQEAQRNERDYLSERADLTESIAKSNIAAVLSGSILTIVALIIACLLVLRDLSARHRAEEALAQEHNLLSSIINAMPNQVYVKDAKGRFILDNSAHRSYLGLDESQSVEGKTVYDYFAPTVA